MGAGLRAGAIAIVMALAAAVLAPAQAMTPRLITGPYVSGWFDWLASESPGSLGSRGVRHRAP